MVIETKRLILREFTFDDFDALFEIMSDKETMQHYPKPFDEERTKGWISWNIANYEEYGFGLWAVVHRDSQEMIGQCGLTLQSWNDHPVLEIGYLFARAHWHHGYATEAVRACMQYAFTALNAGEVHSIIRDTHIASQNVALRCGMAVTDQCVKRFRDEDMRFFLYTAKRADGSGTDIIRR